jgi:hypothetical protein
MCNQTTQSERLISIRARLAALQTAVKEAAEIRQSLELFQFQTSLAAIAGSLPEHQGSDACCICLAGVITRSERALNELHVPTVRGLPHDDPKATHLCITACKRFGYGILSAHDNKADARYNAILCAGKCSAIDRDDQGKVIPGAAYREAVRLAAEYC